MRDNDPIPNIEKQQKLNIPNIEKQKELKFQILGNNINSFCFSILGVLILAISQYLEF
jgi:hypothetical protein